MCRGYILNGLLLADETGRAEGRTPKYKHEWFFWRMNNGDNDKAKIISIYLT